MEDKIKIAVISYTNRKLDSMLLGPITEGEKQHIIQLAIELVLSRENIKIFSEIPITFSSRLIGDPKRRSKIDGKIFWLFSKLKLLLNHFSCFIWWFFN